MSHLRPEESKHSRAACRKGRHRYGESQSIGGGIERRVCGTCGEVTIDLTEADEITTPVRRDTHRMGSLTPKDS